MGSGHECHRSGGRLYITGDVLVYECSMIDALFVGFLEKEIRKDGIPMLDTGDNPDAPAPREMIDLEVGT